MAKQHVTTTINGNAIEYLCAPEQTLLDVLRDVLFLTGSKEGCGSGDCGACSVMLDGRLVCSCLVLGAEAQGKRVETIEGMAKGEELHPLQTAFVRHEGFQCGYCTSGQLCSAVAMLNEVNQGTVSHVTADVRKEGKVALTDDEIRERMSGNICRCGAYPGIVAAIREVNQQTSQRGV